MSRCPFISFNRLPRRQRDPPYHEARNVTVSEGNHMSYAIQWFIFSIGLGAAYVIYVNNWLSKREADET
ncbi:MAG: hypothetical protein M5U34_10385 [Chloroflexi bacterium]|nr:hypothetical protein [Chloroflexota bacterium]